MIQLHAALGRYSGQVYLTLGWCGIGPRREPGTLSLALLFARLGVAWSVKPDPMAPIGGAPA